MIPDGSYYLTVNVVPFGGLKLPFKATITATGSLKTGGSFKTFELRALNVKDATYVSDPIASVTDVAVAADGTFTLSVTDPVVIPDKASPTSSPVHITGFKLMGTIHADSTFCGGMSGTVVEFTKDIATSTFKAVPFGKQSDPPEADCTAAAVKHYPGITTCPTLKLGVNTITTAERDRRFTLYLPDVPTGTTDIPAEVTQQNLPTIVLFHPVGGQMETFVKEITKFDVMLATHKFVLLVPESERGKDGKPISQTEWAYGVQAFGDDNPDLVFFDDMVKCAGQQFKTDKKRLYVTGFSGGGMMTQFTAYSRADVIAAAAPFSGGYLHKYPTTKNKFPEMVTWGGVTDSAFSQDFNKLAADLIAALLGDDHPVVACDHTPSFPGHKWPPEMTEAVTNFLLNFTLDDQKLPAGGLPNGFPAYCKIATK